MTDFSSVLSASGFFLSLVVAIFVARIAIQVRELREALRVSPVSRLKSLETSLAETQDALQEVANRVKMQRVRTAAAHIRDDRAKSNDPDPHREPDRWREWMNAKIARARLNA